MFYGVYHSIVGNNLNLIYFLNLSAVDVKALPWRKHKAEQTTRAELDDKPDPMGMVPETNIFIPSVRFNSNTSSIARNPQKI